jgi:hypothetical protein
MFCANTATALTDCAAIVAVGSVVYHPQKPLRNLTREDVLAQLPAGIDPARVEVVGHHLPMRWAPGPLRRSRKRRCWWRTARATSYRRPAAAAFRRSSIPAFIMRAAVTSIMLQRVISAPRSLNSLGAMYQLVTEFIGFGAFQEGKTMVWPLRNAGLAAAMAGRRYLPGGPRLSY